MLYEQYSADTSCKVLCDQKQILNTMHTGIVKRFLYNITSVLENIIARIPSFSWDHGDISHTFLFLESLNIKSN